MAQTAVRQATSADEPSVCQCVVAAYEHYVPQMGREPAPMLDDYAQLIERGVVFVAEVDGAIGGVIVMWPEPDHFYVDNIAVDPVFQGRGIGSLLLDFADEYALRSQRDEIHLYTNEGMTSNLDYYTRRGFVETHRAVDKGYSRVYFTRRVRSGQS